MAEEVRPDRPRIDAKDMAEAETSAKRRATPMKGKLIIAQGLVIIVDWVSGLFVYLPLIEGRTLR
jgi:hypothetical protein